MSSSILNVSRSAPRLYIALQTASASHQSTLQLLIVLSLRNLKEFHMPHILSFQRNKTSLDCCVVNNINEMCVSLTSARGNDTDLVARLPNMYEKD